MNVGGRDMPGKSVKTIDRETRELRLQMHKLICEGMSGGPCLMTVFLNSSNEDGHLICG